MKKIEKATGDIYILATAYCRIRRIAQTAIDEADTNLMIL